MSESEGLPAHSAPSIILEFVDADPAVPNAAIRGDAARAVVNVLRQDGHSVQAVDTGERGGELFALGLAASQLIVDNKDVVTVLITLGGTVADVILKRFERLTEHGRTREIPAELKVSIHLPNATFDIVAPTLESAVTIADRLLDQYPALVSGHTEWNTVKLQAHVPSPPRRPRR